MVLNDKKSTKVYFVPVRPPHRVCEGTKISVVILTKNEEQMIKDCLHSVSWVDEIVVIDSSSSDQTVSIAKKLGSKVYPKTFEDFAKQRNFGFSKTTGDWVFYLDADERVSQKLAKEILEKIDKPCRFVAFKISRLNIFFGKSMQHGDWFPDYQTRLFKRASLKGWFGAIHESAKVEGRIGRLINHLIHLSHRSLGACFEKSITWTKIEAELLFKARHPKVTIFHLVKVTLGQFFWRVFLKRGWQDGTIGWLEGMVQSFNKFLVYAQLWEKQQKSYR